MPRGRPLRSTSIILFALVLLGVFATLSSSESPNRNQYGSGILPIGGVATSDANGRHSFVAHGPSGIPRSQYRQADGTMAPMQWTGTGPAPTPDTDLTASLVLPATAPVGSIVARVLDPSTAPTGTQDRVVFVSDGVDVGDDPANPVADGRIDPLLPTDSNFKRVLNIWIMRPDGSEQKQIQTQGIVVDYDKREPVFDPGGRLVTYSSDATGRWEIYQTEIATGVTKCLTASQPGNKRHPSWSPDSLWITYACDAPGHYEIFRIRSDGSSVQERLTMGAEDCIEPNWAPAPNVLSAGADAILFTAKTGTISHISCVDPVTKTVTPLTNGGGDPAVSDKQAVFSHDGASFAFASNRKTSGADTVTNFNIWRIASSGEADASAEAVIVSDNLDTASTADSTYPAWQPVLRRQPLRLFYQSNRSPASGTNQHIWSTLINDTTPPILVDLPWVDNRQPQPGADITIYAKVWDADTGVGRVTAIIKDPNRKIWRTSTETFNTGFTGTRYQEWDYAPVGSVDLTDDGPAGGNGDAVAGDGVFTGKWTTPTTGSDFVIDIAVQDQSTTGNSLDYDSIYGFSTLPFSPKSNVLFVNDYCEGQKFIYSFGGAGGGQRVTNNAYPSAWMTESFYTTNPTQAASNVDFDSISGYAQSWGVTEPYDIWRVICRGPIPANVYQYYLPTVEYQLDPADALTNGEKAIAKRAVKVADRAVIWACPHAGDVWIGSSQPKGSPRPVETTGSLVDADTQAALGLFLSRGGRLFLSGEDIAWALTLNGTITNDFLQRYLHCNFVQDVAPVTTGGAAGARSDRWPTDPAAERPILNVNYGYAINAAGSGTAPVRAITTEPWPAGSPASHVRAPSAYDTGDYPTSFLTSRYPQPNDPQTFRDAHDWSIRPDVITPINSNETLYTYDGGSVAGIVYADATTESRVIYLSFGFEQIHRDYHTPSNLPAHCMNHRSHLLHNAMCWMRTGAFQGKVLSISDGSKPVRNPNPIVFLYAPGSTAPDYAVRCQDDGTYVLQGVTPGYYRMEVTRPGFEISHFDGWVTHGGWQPFTVDFAMSRSRPAAVSGIVTSQATGKPIPLVKVRAYHKPVAASATDTAPVGPPYDLSVLGTAVGETTTAADGSYTLPALTVDPLNPEYVILADGTDQGYSTLQQVAKVTPGSTTTLDFVLTAADGTVTATVLGLLDANDPTKTTPLANAEVQLLDETGNAVGQSASTDANGVVSVSVQPGTYKVTAQAAGYAQPTSAISVSVQSLQTETRTITLSPLPPGNLSGQVISATSKSAVGDIPVDFYLGGVKVHTEYTSWQWTTPTDGRPQYNYRWANAKTGRYTVRPNPSGFKASPTQLENVEIVSGQDKETVGVNFALTSLQTFPAGLQLISLPYSYEATDPDRTKDANDPAKLLGVSDLAMATWETTTDPTAWQSRYRLYPQAPADHFRLGRGYWLRLDSAADLTRSGRAATDPIRISLGKGWNLVGNPYNVNMDLYLAQFEDSSGTVRDFQSSLSAGRLATSLFAYVLGGYRTVSVFTPWVGYWIKANDNMTMILSQTTGALAAKTATASRNPVRVPEGGWLLPLTASADGMVDECTYLGVGSKSDDGYKAGLDMPKPPAVNFGPYVYAAAVEDSWGTNSGSYAVDIKPSGNSQTWALSVTTSQVGAPVTISWPDLSALPNSVRPVLVDVASGRRTYMRTARAYTFTASTSERRLQVVVEADSSSSLALSAVSAQQASASTAIAYTLSCAANVDVEVRNISGNLIRRVSTGQIQPAGRNQALWNERNESGSPVPAGRYLVLVRARTDAGQETQAVTTLMVRR